MSSFEEAQLLDLIEGELDSAAAAAMRGALASDPTTLARVARIEHDRLELRSLPQPEIPVEIRAQLESILARPMLMEAARPGVYRRQQRRLAWQRRLRRLAAAASIALVVAAGAWMVAMLAVPQLTKAISRAMLAERTDSVDLNTIDSTAPVSAVATGVQKPSPTMTVTELNAITRSNDVVHHYLPLSVSTGAFAVDQPGVRNAARTSEISVPDGVVEASFAIVVFNRDSAVVEQALIAAAKQTGRSTGLVRNFSFAEAQKIQDELRLVDSGDRSQLPPMMADADQRPAPAPAPSMAVLAAQVQKRLEVAGRSQAPYVSESGIIMGSADFSPTLEQQLSYSSRGATHTVMVRAEAIEAMLAQLGQIQGITTSLRMLNGGETRSASEPPVAPPTMNDMNEWMQQVSHVRDAAGKLVQEHGNSMVLVPVIVASGK